MESKGRRMGHRGREREIIAQGLNTSPDDKKKKNMSSSLTHREFGRCMGDVRAPNHVIGAEEKGQ